MSTCFGVRETGVNRQGGTYTEEGRVGRKAYHFGFLEERVIFAFKVAFGAVEPFSTWERVRKGIFPKEGRKTYSRVL